MNESEKKVYFFSVKGSDGNKDMKDLLGGKGANMAEMANLGVPVPPGFTIATTVCKDFYENNEETPKDVQLQIDEHLERLEKEINRKLGDSEDPLLVSVRSGAAQSLPGMMDTVLNLGLNDTTVDALAKKSGNERFAWDAYRRFCQMFGDVVMNVEHHDFEKILDEVKKEKNVDYDTDLTTDDLKELVLKYKDLIQEKAGKLFPQDPKEQLKMAIEAVFKSWNNERAILYRQINNIHGLLGTAVNVQTMVFGNMGETSGTGVCFSRDPATGKNEFYGEYLMNAQGEDVVAGIRTPQKITQLQEVMPACYEELVSIYKKLESHYKDMQDMEFTIQEGKLFMLQTRTGKRTAQAALKIAVDMVDEGLIDTKTAVLRIDPNALDQLLHPTFKGDAKKTANVLTTGLPASPGAAVGKIIFNSEEAADKNEAGEKVILVRVETSPEDLMGMNAAKGILTARGGMTSHAAVVARGMGKCCISGCNDIKIDYEAQTLTIGDKVFNKLDYISLDGSTGEVLEGDVETEEPKLEGNFATLMKWADEFRTMNVRTNADTPKDANQAITFGAEGIGLCRTEHMFFEGDRIKAMREMIVASNVEDRKKALAKIKPYQKEDFKGLFLAMGNKPVTIRLLDPPLHEFLPHEEAEQKLIAIDLGITVDELKQKMESLSEVNPMLGHRGCRLGITYPEITEMQTEAIIEAAIEVNKEKGLNIIPEIMIPLIGNVTEFRNQSKVVKDTANKIIADGELKYLVGTMIEVPRGALTAHEIAKEADFFSFGTNDLTQMTLGFSRDDVSKFVPEYVKKGILNEDPFQKLDQTGVGQLVEIAATRGREVRANIKLGICGEHGGEPSSIEFCHKQGLNYVSCSPFRVPIARLAAAQAAIKHN